MTGFVGAGFAPVMVGRKRINSNKSHLAKKSDFMNKKDAS